MEERETEDRSEDDREKKDGFPWWELPDILEMIVAVARGIWGLGAMIVGAFRD
ncbi:hypothetical protein [Methylobacterium sp. Gmos1]